jgi:hypothetical protein
MAKSYKKGQIIYVDGILARCEKDHILLSPAVGRDSRATFSGNL